MKREATEKTLKSVNSPKISASNKRSARKVLIMDQFNKSQQQGAANKAGNRLSRWMNSGFAPKLSLSLSGIAVLVVTVFGITTFVTTPLTTEKVLAEAVSAYQANPEGRYRYSKEKVIDNFGGEEKTTINETWEDTEGDRFRVQTSLEDGTVLSIDQFNDKNHYSYNNEEAYNDLYDFSDSFIGDDLEGDIEFPDFSVDEIIPGAEAAGLTFENFTEFSMEEIDQKLKDAGQDTYFDKVFGTIDFPGYTLSGEETEKLDFNEYSEYFPEEEKFYAGSDQGFVDPGDAAFVDGIEIDGPSEEEFQKIDNAYQLIDKLQTAASDAERKKLIEEIKNQDGVTLLEEQDWNGKRVIGIQHEIVFGLDKESVDKSTTYFDSTTFRIVGNESSFSLGGEKNSFTSIQLEETFSNDEPDFSVEGLEENSFHLDGSEFSEFPIDELDDGIIQGPAFHPTGSIDSDEL